MAGTCTTAHPRILPLLHWRRHAVLAHPRQHQCTRSRTRLQSTGTQGHHVRMIMLHTQHHAKHQRTSSRTRPQPSDTPGHHARATSLHTPRHTRRSRCPRSSPRHLAHTAPFFLKRGLTNRSRHPRWPRRTRAAPFSCSGFPPSSRPAGCSSCLRHVAPIPLASTHAPAVHYATLALRHAALRPACAHTHARTRARATDGERRDVRSAGVAD